MKKETLKKGEIIPLTFDYVFTSIFNNPANIDIVESFLAAYFNEKIKNIKGKVKINNRDLIRSNKKESRKQVDLVLDLKGEKINIELNNDLYKGKEDRNIVYASKIHGRQLKKGNTNYNSILRTLQINLNNFASNKNKLKETYYLKNEEGEILTKKFQIDYIDLEKAKKNLYNEDEKLLARWCRVIKSNTKEELKKELGEGLMERETKEKLVDEVNKYTDDEEVYALYSDYTKEELERNTLINDLEIAKKDLETLKEESNKAKKELEKVKDESNKAKQKLEKTKEELKKSRIRIAKRMLKDKMDTNLIMNYTDLTKEEINNIDI